MPGHENTLKAIRKDGLVEFRREIKGISRVLATAPSSEPYLRALAPHFPEDIDLDHIGLGISIELADNLSFSQPMSQAIDKVAEAHLAVFVTEVEENGPCHNQDIAKGDEIWSLDGQMLRDLERHEIHNLLFGRAGSLAHLIIMRYSEEENQIIIGDAVAKRRELVKSHAVVVGRWPSGFVPVSRCIFSQAHLPDTFPSPEMLRAAGSTTPPTWG